VEQRAVVVLADPLYRGFGPTLAAEYLHKPARDYVSKETLRRWMVRAGLWKAGRPARGGTAPMAAATEPLW